MPAKMARSMQEIDPDWDARSEADKAALRAGALSATDRKMQIWGLPCHWREAGPFDWTGCDQVEVVVGKVSGVPLLVKTRMPADSVLQHFEWDETPEEIADTFDLDIEQVRAVLRFAGVLDRTAIAA